MQNCYKPKIPKDLQVDQNDRLSNKHIQTLKFLQEIVAENKELKAKVVDCEGKLEQCAELHQFAEDAKEKIKKIQEQYLGRADEINAMLVEKHKAEIMEKVEEKIQAEKKWLEEKEKLEAEIVRLTKEKNKSGTEECKEHDHKIRMLDLKVAAQAQELQRLMETNKSLKVTEENQTAELQRLKNIEAKNKSIKDEIAALIQTNKELNFKISRLEKELSGKEGTVDQEEIMNTLKNKLAKLYKENGSLETKQKTHLNQIESLENEINLLRKALADSEAMRDQMQQQLDGLILEIDMLRKHMNSKDREKDRERENFKEFVQLKREVQQLREEVEFYKGRLASNKSAGHLPGIKVGGGSGKGTAVKRIASDKTKPHPPGFTVFKS